MDSVGAALVAGACAYRRINLSAIWFAAAAALSLAVIVFATARRRD
jgi:hypothetical protein